MSEEQIKKDTTAEIVIPVILPEASQHEELKLCLKKVATSSLVHYAAHCGVHPDANEEWDQVDEIIGGLKVGQTLTVTGKNKVRHIHITRLRGATVWKFDMFCTHYKKDLNKDAKEEMHEMFTAVKIDGACMLYSVPDYIIYRHQRSPYGREVSNALPRDATHNYSEQRDMVAGIIERGFVGGAAELFSSFLSNPNRLETAIRYLKSVCLKHEEPETPTIQSLKKRLFPNKNDFWLRTEDLHPKERVQCGQYIGYGGVRAFDTIAMTTDLSLLTSRGVRHAFRDDEAKQAAILGLKTRGAVPSPWGACRYDKDFLHIGCHRFHLPLFIATLSGEKYVPESQEASEKDTVQADLQLATAMANYHNSYVHDQNNFRPVSANSVTLTLQQFLDFYELKYTEEEWKALTNEGRRKAIQDRKQEWHGYYKDRQYITAVTRARQDWNTNKDKYVSDAVSVYTAAYTLFVNQGETKSWYECIRDSALSLNVNIAAQLKRQ